MTFKYKSEVVGRGGISARIVAKSVSAYSGQEIITWEYDAPKYLLGEINTHTIMVRNAQSSRAVPVKKVIEQIRTNPVTPIHWGKNQAGMVAEEENDKVVVFRNDGKLQIDGYRLDEFEYLSKEPAWKQSAEVIAELMEAFSDAGYHKQIVNRIGEAFTFVRGVITATEIDNFFHLRYHKDADPYMYELAKCMWEAYEQAEAEVLYEGEWHTPYVPHWRDANNDLFYYRALSADELSFSKFIDGVPAVFIEEDEALKTSSAACGQISYRKLDTSEETVERVWNNLMGGDTIHASVTGHQATPMKYPTLQSTIQFIDGFADGVTHVDKDLDFWSAQFKHWVMHRKTIPGEYCKRFHLRDKSKEEK